MVNAQLEQNQSTGIYHIVQISRDESLFKRKEDYEPVSRQLDYGKILSKLVKNGVITILVLTNDRSFKAYKLNNVQFIPLTGVLRGRLKIWRNLKKLNKELPISLITTQTVYDEAWIAQLFCKFYNCRIVGQVHSELYSEASIKGLFGTGVIAKIRWRLTLYTLKYFHGIRTVNEETRRILLSRRLSHNVESIPVRIQWPANTNYEKDKDKNIITVARLSKEKNITDFIYIANKVLERDKDVRFTIIGDGPERKDLEALVTKLSLNRYIQLKGYMKNTELGDLYKFAVACVVTSKHEGFGRVLIESYAYGAPVVAYKAAGPNEIISDKVTGFLHEQGDIDSMADSVLRLVMDKEKARKMAEKGRLLLNNKYNPEVLIEKWVMFLLSNIRKPMKHLVMPRTRTWKRWKKIAFSRYTILRSLEYDAISDLTLYGKTLDIGGGVRTSYKDIIIIRGSLTSVNIDKELKPTVLADLNGFLPFNDGVFDNVISFNTFEHIMNDQLAISEALRVLISDGEFHFTVPFLYQVHGSPNDYHRHTANWWIDFLIKNGANEGTLTLDPLVWDRFSSAYSLVGHGPVGRVIKKIVTFPAMIGDLGCRKRYRLKEISRNMSNLNLPLGYKISGTKK